MKRGCGGRGWAKNSVNRAQETRSTRTEFGVEDGTTALRAAGARLAAVSDTARLDAELLMAHALGVERAVLLLDPSRFAAPADFEALVARRLAHEPVAYILGTRDFWTIDRKSPRLNSSH